MLHTRGIRLHAVTAGQPEDPLIVLLHGTFGGWFDYLSVISPLAQRGFHVAALDMRGYGMSDKPRPRTGNAALIAVGDVKGAITALGHREAVIVGSDTGGSVGWAMATAHPDMVTGLVSVSSAHPADLRAAIVARPWDFLPLLGRLAISLLPAHLLEHSRMLQHHTHRCDLQLNTTQAFQRSPTFEDVLRLRRTAAAIDNACVHALLNARLLTSSAPHRARVMAPTLLIHPAQSLWNRLVRRQRHRVDAAVEELTIADSKNLPHIENPAGFISAVAAFAAAHREP